MEEWNMTIYQHTVFSNVFTIFYNLINNYVPDPLSRNTKWIFAEFPESDVAESKVKYPIIIIEPANITWEKFTQTRQWNMIDIKFSVYSKQMIQADSLLNQINSIMDHNRNLLRNDDGLSFINLEDTDTDFELRAGTRIHIRSARYSMKSAFISGISKIAISKTINSNGEIA